MRFLFWLSIFFLFITPLGNVSAQYPTPPPSCVCPTPAPACGNPPGSFAVCNHDPEGCNWGCTNADSQCCSSCWSDWSGCGPGVCGETRYCLTPGNNDAQARNCPGQCGNPGPTDPPFNPPTNTPGGATATPTPPSLGTIEARAVRVDPADTSCTAIKAVLTTDGEINGTTLQFTPSSASEPTPQTQVGANYVTFADIVTGSYTLDPVPPTADWVFARACSTNLDNGTTGEGLSRTLPANSTIRWDVGYTLGTSWVQTEGGDVYAAGTVRSFIPAVTPRVFNLDGDAGYPGVVTYGTGYDFDSDPFSTGGTLISSTNWEVNTSRSRINYYDFFYSRYGSPATPTTDPAFDNPLAVTKPPSSATPYYVVGDMTTSGNWSVGSGESIVILVNGNVTLGGRVNITGSGFIAFIVNGTITVVDTVGTTSASTTPVIEGVYVAMKDDLTGSFETGSSVAAATARFVGRGMFIADGFVLGRNLEGFGVGNTGAAAELFTYNPQLLFTMPDGMKELSVTWQEVAP